MPVLLHAMVLVVAAQEQQARLVEKKRWRNNAMIDDMMPDGVHEATGHVTLLKEHGGDVGAYCAAIRSVSRGFVKLQRATSTAKEHDSYMIIMSDWAVEQGFGALVEVKEVETTSTGAMRRVLQPAVNAQTASWLAASWARSLHRGHRERTQ